MRSLLRRIPPTSLVGRALRKVKRLLSALRRALHDVTNPPFSIRYPKATEEAYEIFCAAVEKLPPQHAPNTRSLKSVVFDGFIWGARFHHRSIFDVLNTVRCLTRPTAPKRRDEVPAERKVSGLKLLFVTAMFPGAEHGGGLRVFDMITELADRGHSVSLYSPEDAGGSSKTLALLQSKLSSCRIVKPGSFSPADYAAWLSREGVHYDAIHYVWPYSSTLMPTGKQWTNNSVFELIESCTRRCLMDVERFIEEGRAESIEHGAFSLMMNWKLEHDAISSADRVIALTDTDAAFTSELFGVPSVDVVPQGISKTFVLDRVKEAGDAPPSFGEHSAIFLGNYNHYPNKDGLLWFLTHVHPKVIASVPSFKLVVAGAGNISDIKRRLTDTPGVVCLGEVEDLVGTLQSGKICIAPLISGAGIRGKVNQYSCVRRPTVSTRIGACGTPYRHEESIMIADEPEQFAQHIVKLLTDRQLYEKIRANASDVALEHFSWAPLIKNLEAIYVAA